MEVLNQSVPVGDIFPVFEVMAVSELWGETWGESEGVGVRDEVGIGQVGVRGESRVRN